MIPDIVKWAVDRLYREVIQSFTIFPVVAVPFILMVYHPSFGSVLLVIAAFIFDLLLSTLNLEIAAQRGLEDLRKYLAHYPEITFVEHDLSKTLPPELKDELANETLAHGLPRYLQINKPPKGALRPSVITSFTVPTRSRVLQSCLIFDYSPPVSSDPVRTFRVLHEVCHASTRILFGSRQYRWQTDDFVSAGLPLPFVISWTPRSLLLAAVWLGGYLLLLRKSAHFQRTYCWVESQTDLMALRFLNRKQVVGLHERVVTLRLLRDSRMSADENDLRLRRLEQLIGTVATEWRIPSQLTGRDVLLDCLIVVWLFALGSQIEARVGLVFGMIALISSVLAYVFVDAWMWRETQRLEFMAYEELKGRVDMVQRMEAPLHPVGSA